MRLRPRKFLQVSFLLFNIASYYECVLHTVDIRGDFLNTEFTSADALYFCKSEHIDKLNGRNVSCHLQWLYSIQGL